MEEILSSEMFEPPEDEANAKLPKEVCTTERAPEDARHQAEPDQRQSGNIGERRSNPVEDPLEGALAWALIAVTRP